ncbi:hypothetical protein SUGI_0288950 [Cryptomeria japonica]|uniref:putative serine/threonine-protein kinase-like protein CCR3 n=1 Tax=Cryptomeria japonica TaxID=3369 RepID=UPI002408D70C|nr:putative serine/threonine-protein kinase-like protein CCR3 [Cryptomeria japonica]GLJ16780.1 hypothetical protein SUGI_0288950 [Cryptomeria japonica]
MRKAQSSNSRPPATFENSASGLNGAVALGWMWLLLAMGVALGLRFESRGRNNWEFLVGLLWVCAVLCDQRVDAQGSMSTISASFKGNVSTVCAIRAGGNNILCWNSTQQQTTFSLGASYMGISGGNGSVCGLTEDRRRVFCWDTETQNRKRLSIRRRLIEVAAGGTHACGLYEGRGDVYCWRGLESPPSGGNYTGITVGSEFACGINETNSSVQCWGTNPPQVDSRAMSLISAGNSSLCGIGRDDGRVVCWGSLSGLVPTGENSSGFDSLVVGANYVCARRIIKGTLVCWGSIQGSGYPQNVSFEDIVGTDGFACGIVTRNLSVLCWGGKFFGNSFLISPLNNTLPGDCEQRSSCPCGISPNSETLCGGSGSGVSRVICKSCPPPPPPPATAPPPLPPPPPPSPLVPPVSPRVIRKMSRAAIALTVLGSVGVLVGVVTVSWFLYFKYFRHARQRSGRVCDAEQEQNQNQQQQQSSTPPVSSASQPKRQTSVRGASRQVRRQRSGTSKGEIRRQRSGPSKRGDRAEEFSLTDLSLATDGFSENSKLGSGSFGTVYLGTLPDGRKVAIKRGDSRNAKKNKENESAFESELSFMTRLHHKHLVGLVGYCEEEEERLLVYEYMSNGSLHDHLHKAVAINPPLDSWAMRIRIALDAARGIEYLHTYAVPPIIHRDIKSSNILLDGSWNAKVSDFGLSLLGPMDEESHLSLMAAGTVGYIDPEYYKMQHLTTKSDVYSYGVVLMELLTGKKAIHKHDGSGGPRNVVDFALPYIVNDDLPSILDDRLPPPRPYEIEAVTFVGLTAMDCVNLEGKDRPSMTEIVASLETALAFCSQAASRSASRTRSPPSNDDNFSVL